jgi:hypothetical protein
VADNVGGTPVLADVIGYSGIVDISAETGVVRAEHRHDWSAKTRDARWKMMSTTKDPFTSENDYSYLLLRDKATGAEIFRGPVPALTYLWISPDSKYVVGVSNVMLLEPLSACCLQQVRRSSA